MSFLTVKIILDNILKVFCIF